MLYHIEKNTIQETLVIPLYGRALCTRKFPQLFADQTAAELLEQIDYDFSALEQRSGGLLQTFGALEVAMRQSDLAFEVREYLRAHPRAAVVNLGCGLDSTGHSCCARCWRRLRRDWDCCCKNYDTRRWSDET